MKIETGFHYRVEWITKRDQTLACVWALYGLTSLVCICVGGVSGEDLMFPLWWIGVIVLLLLFITGIFAMLRKLWGWIGLLVMVGIVCLWGVDICYAFLWHGRFPFRFWFYVCVITVGLATLVSFFISITHVTRRKPPVISAGDRNS